MCHSICNQQICENLFSVNLPSLRFITTLHIYMVRPYLHVASVVRETLIVPVDSELIGYSADCLQYG